MSRFPVAKRFEKIIGASFVEFSLAAIVFMLLVLGFVDFVRFTAAQAILIRGAQEGLNLAVKAANVDMAPSRLSSATDLATFKAARDLVISAAMRFPISTMVGGSGSNSYIKLLAYTDQTVSGSQVSDAVLIRPGERYVCSDGSEATHPTIAASSYASLSSQSYPTVLLSHPFVVQMRADFRTVLPLIPPFKITGRAIGFREDFLRAGHSVSPSMLPTSTGPTTTVGPGSSPTSTIGSTTTTLPQSTTTTLSGGSSSTTSTTTTTFGSVTTTTTRPPTTVPPTTTTTTCVASCTYPKVKIGCVCRCDADDGWVDDGAGGCARGRGG